MSYESEAEQRNFRWAYAAIVALAVELLAKMNREREHCNDWPAGQFWDELSGSSKDIFMRQAREKAGIPTNHFLALVRGEYSDDEELEKLYAQGPPSNLLLVDENEYIKIRSLAEDIATRSHHREWSGEDEHKWLVGLREILNKPDLPAGPYNVRIKPAESENEP